MRVCQSNCVTAIDAHAASMWCALVAEHHHTANANVTAVRQAPRIAPHHRRRWRSSSRFHRTSKVGRNKRSALRQMQFGYRR